MANVISDETIEYVGILAKLELSDEDKENAKKDMASMLDYIDKLGELDTEGIEPMSHIFPVQNVMREDVVTNGDGSDDTLKNAPESNGEAFIVPKTVDQSERIVMSLLDLTATQLAKAIKKGDVTAVDAMQAVIEQIENKEKELNCYVTFDNRSGFLKSYNSLC